MRRDSYNFLLLLFAIRIYIFRLDTRKKKIIKIYQRLSARRSISDTGLDTLEIVFVHQQPPPNSSSILSQRISHKTERKTEKERERNRKKLPKLSHNPTLSLVSRSILLFHGARNNLAPPPSFVPNLLSFYPMLVSLSLSRLFPPFPRG